jgi:hypothetical protein
MFSTLKKETTFSFTISIALQQIGARRRQTLVIVVKDVGW